MRSYLLGACVILVAVACAGLLTGNAFATGLPAVSRVAALLALAGALIAFVGVRAPGPPAPEVV